jgi:hypothetical protein
MGKRIPVQIWVPQQSTLVVRVPAVIVPSGSPGATPVATAKTPPVEREIFVEKGELVMGPTLRDRQSKSVTLWRRARE